MLEELRETYNTSKREVARLEQELKNSKENILKITTMYHKSAAELEKERQQFEERVRNFNDKLEEMESENASLRSSPKKSQNAKGQQRNFCISSGLC